MTRTAAPRGRVLLVEDEPQLAKTYVAALVNAGFQVTRAATGTQALDTIQTRQFDVVVTDVSIPGIGGIDLLRRLCRRAAGIHVILMLDAPDNRLAVQGLEAGVLQYLVKPIESEALQQTVARAVLLVRGAPGAFLHDRNGEPIEAASLTATRAKSEFGHVLDVVIQGGVVVITKHDTPKAVMVSYAHFKALAGGAARQLNRLSAEFDELLSRMQTPQARAGLKAAFDASPAKLAKAAVAAARRRG